MWHVAYTVGHAQNVSDYNGDKQYQKVEDDPQ